jgi:RNase H-fold protein (predicted Holliday junction resolvase)
MKEAFGIFINGVSTSSTSRLSEYLNGSEDLNGYFLKLQKYYNVKQHPNVPIVMYDERFTSVLAHQAMLDGGLKKKDRQNKALVDEISATIILQSFMESEKMNF